MHLGNIASRIGERLTYDFRAGRFVNHAKAYELLSRRRPAAASHRRDTNTSEKRLYRPGDSWYFPSV